MKYKILHKTTYQYDFQVTFCQSLAVMTPRDLPGQRCKIHKLYVKPLPKVKLKYRDFFGNEVHYLSIQQPHQEMVVAAQSTVELQSYRMSPPGVSLTCREAMAMYQVGSDAMINEAKQFVVDSPMVPLFSELKEYGQASFDPGESLVQSIQNLMSRIYSDFTFDQESTTVHTPLRTVLEEKKGVCQDYTHFMIGCLRSMKIPARYVSGYIETLPPPGSPKLTGVDASHAWVSTYIPTVGWIDWDPTNNLIPSTQHITVAWGRDYSDVTPLKGVTVGNPQHVIHVSVDVKKEDE